jgi:hypothetical protein
MVLWYHSDHESGRFGPRFGVCPLPMTTDE